MEPASNSFGHNQPVYSISEIALSIKRMVEDKFGTLTLRGEISGWKVASSGHVYFRLKDDKAVIDGVMWRGVASKLSFKPEDGLEVTCRGKVTTYPGRSSYQIVVEHMEPAGEGALMALLEKRKKALEAEGLFAADKKQALPFLPKTIGVITSPTGAVIRDILHRIEERFPSHVLVWPVAVQGEAAAEQIAAAIKGFNELKQKPDVIIVARGGGSIEDLWAFNEEVVVRAAFASAIPIISAVGHETDTTLIDFVSDKRAPTPTAAAEMTVPVREELWLGIKQLDARLAQAMQRHLQQKNEQLQGLARGLPKPDSMLQTMVQRLDDWSERLQQVLPNYLHKREQQLTQYVSLLRPQLLQQQMVNYNGQLEQLSARSNRVIHNIVSKSEQSLELQSKLLESLNYKKVLERGYAIVKDESGKVVSSVGTAKDKTLEITFKDGVISAES